MRWLRDGDWANPVTVKEVRQIGHGWYLPVLQLLILIVLFFRVSLRVLYSNAAVLNGFAFAMIHAGKNSSSDTGLFYLVIVGASVCSVLLGGICGMFRYATERENRDMDVGNFTPLSPVKLVLGRLWAALAVQVYFFSLAAPCLVIAYHWGGISLDLGGRALVLASIVSSLLIQLFLSLGARGYKSLAVIVLGALFFFGMPMMLVSLFWLGSCVTSGPLWACVCVFGIMLFCMLVAENVGYLTAFHGNRYCGFRKLAIGFAILSVMMFYGWGEYTDQALGETCQRACLVAFLLFLVVCVGGTSLLGMDRAGLRLREGCSENFLGRLWRYLFANVWGGSLSLCWLALLVGVGVMSICCHGLLSESVPCLSFFGYLLFYLELTQFIRLLCPTFKSVKTMILVLVLCNGLPALAMIWGQMASGSARFANWDFSMLWHRVMMPSIFYSLDCTKVSPTGLRLYAGVILAAVGFFLLLPAIARQFRLFRRPSQQEWERLFTPQGAARRDSEP